MAKPVIVRDKFCESGFFVFVPADKDRKYWARYSLGWPSYASPQNRLYPIKQVHFGIVREGKWQDPNDAAKAGVWTEFVSYGWHRFRASDSGKTLTFTIPSTHNRIHVFTYKIAGRGIVSLLLDGSTDGLDVTTIDTGSGDTIKETIVATNASGTEFKITTDDDGKNHNVIGIHTFDDDKVGDPASETAGIGDGHDLVDQFVLSGVNYDFLNNEEIAGQVIDRIIYANTVEFTMSWAPLGETPTWTAYGTHYGDHPFRATTEPILYIDGVSQGAMWDITNILLGELHEADSIVQFVEGYGDFDGDEVEDPEDVLKVRLTQDFTPTGLGIVVKIRWSGDATVSALYVPSVPIESDITGVLKLLPDEAEIAIGSNWSGKKGNGIYVYPDGIDCVIFVGSLGPMDSMFEQAATNKFYCSIDKTLLEGGATPGNGDIWTVGGFIQIMKRRTVKAPASRLGGELE